MKDDRDIRKEIDFIDNFIFLLRESPRQEPTFQQGVNKYNFEACVLFPNTFVQMNMQNLNR